MKTKSSPNLATAESSTSITQQSEEELRYKILFWTFVLSIFIPPPVASVMVSSTAGFNLGWKVGGEKNLPFTRRLLHAGRCALGSAGMSAAIFAGLFIAASTVIAVSAAITSPPLFALSMIALAVGTTYAQGKLGAQATLWTTKRFNQRVTAYPAPEPSPPVPAKKHQKAPKVTQPEKSQSLLLKIASVLAKPIEWIVGKPIPTPASDPENPSPAPKPSASTAKHSPSPVAYTSSSKSQLASINIPAPILTGLRLISSGVSKLVPSFMRRSSKSHDKGSGLSDASG